MIFNTFKGWMSLRGTSVGREAEEWEKEHNLLNQMMSALFSLHHFTKRVITHSFPNSRLCPDRHRWVTKRTKVVCY